MITTTSIITEQLRSFADPAGKIMRMTKSGELFPLTRGIYETDGSVLGELLASVIYGPSYQKGKLCRKKQKETNPAKRAEKP